MSREFYELELTQPSETKYCASTGSVKEKARRMSDGARVDLHTTLRDPERYEECRCPDQT